MGLEPYRPAFSLTRWLGLEDDAAVKKKQRILRFAHNLVMFFMYVKVPLKNQCLASLDVYGA